MRCINKKCEYTFIRKEVNYIACPNCGKAVKENLPKDTNKRVELYQIIKSFQTCLRFEKNKYYIIFRSAFILIFLSMITYPLHDGMHYNSLIMNSMRLNSNSNILLLLLVFFMPFDRYKPFKKFKKEKAWLFKSVWFKILRLTLIFFITTLMFKIFIPNFFTYYLDLFKKRNLSVPLLYHKTIFYYIGVWWLILAVVLNDLTDLYFRWRCKKLDKNLY